MAPVIRIYPDGAWVDITGDLRLGDGLTIERGRAAESDITNSLATFVLDNRSPYPYSSDVPGTTWYRKFGRGTLVEITDTTVTDSFSHVESGGWGLTESPGSAWANAGGSGSDYSIAGGKGRHTLSTTVSSRLTSVNLSMRDVVVRATVTIGALTTGATARAALVTRRTPNGGSHYRFELQFATTGVVTAAIVRLGGPSNAELDTAALTATYTAGTTFNLVGMSVGEQHYLKAWASTETEPAGWTCEVEDAYLHAGDCGLRSVRDSGNTNASLTFDFDTYSASEPRFFGEVWSIRPTSDGSGKDLTVTVEASGILRRLSNTAKPLRSPLYRTLSTGVSVTSPTTTPVAYWPLEDGSLATQLEQAVDGAPRGLFSGEVSLSSESSLVGSDALPTLGDHGFLSGNIPTISGFDATTTEWSYAFLVKIDEVPEEDTRIGWMATYSTASAYELVMETDGDIVFRAPYANPAVFGYDFTATAAFDYAVDAAAEQTLMGQWVLFTVYSTIWGPGDYEVTVQWTSAQRNGALGSLSSGSGATVRYPPKGPWLLYGALGSSRSFGHLSVWATLALADYRSAIGWTGEQARTRILRLCEEEGITADAYGLGTEYMGPQLLDTLLANLEDCASTDLGVLLEPRHLLGVKYRSRTTLYNQVPAATLDVSAKGLTDGFAPIRDDAAGLANRVEATRTGGTLQVAEIADGDVFHLTSEDPPDGIGLVTTSIGPNVETDQLAAAQAGWHVHLRATREPRYEQVTVFLHAPTYTADPELAASVSGLEIGDCIELSNQPGWSPPDPIELLVQGVTEFSDGIRREITLNCTPAVPWEVWNIDTSGSTLVRAIDSDDTSLRFATSSGPEWVTSPEPGFLVQIAGEAMGVTGVSTDTATYVGVGAASHGDNASLAPALPGSVAVGDAMILVAAIRNTAASVTTPSGWTVLSSAYNAFRVYGRYNVSGDTAPTVAFSGGAAGDTTSAYVFALRGTSLDDSDARFGATTDSPENQSNSSAQNIAYPAMSVRRDGSVVLYAAWKQDDFTSSAGPGDAEIIEASTVTGNDQSLVAYYDIQTTATDVTAGTITITGGASAISRVILLALRPTQTVTVTRSANGVVQSAAAGEAVHVWRHGAMPL